MRGMGGGVEVGKERDGGAGGGGQKGPQAAWDSGVRAMDWCVDW